MMYVMQPWQWVTDFDFAPCFVASTATRRNAEALRSRASRAIDGKAVVVVVELDLEGRLTALAAARFVAAPDPVVDGVDVLRQ